MNALTQEKPAGTQERPTRTMSEPARYLVPDVNIYESKDGYILEAEMPGVNKSGLEVTLEDNQLTIQGHRSEEPVNGEVLYRETREFDYRRVFELDPMIDSSRITAKMDQGVLKLQLPKAEKVKPRKIKVGD